MPYVFMAPPEREFAITVTAAPRPFSARGPPPTFAAGAVAAAKLGTATLLPAIITPLMPLVVAAPLPAPPGPGTSDTPFAAAAESPRPAPAAVAPGPAP